MEAGLAYRKRGTIKGLHAQEPHRDPLDFILSIPSYSSIELDSVLLLPLSSKDHSILQIQLLPSCVLCVQLCPTVCDPMDYSPPGSSVHGILRQEYCSGLPFLTPGNLPNPGIKPRSPELQAESFTTEPSGKPSYIKIKALLISSGFWLL